MKLDPHSMKRRQLPRRIGEQVCEFRGIGTLPVVHLQFLDMKNRRYEHKARAGLQAQRVKDQLAAFDNSDKLVAVQIDKGGPENLSFEQWWGILRFSDLEVSDEGVISFAVVDRVTHWPAE